jgi:hypothetical protein
MGIVMLAAGTHWAAIVTSGAAIVAAFGLFFVLIQIVDGRRSRDAQTTADLSRRWDEGDVRLARLKVNKLGPPEAVRDEIVTLRGKKSPEYYELLCEPNYFEDLAILCHRKALDDRMIRESLGELVSKRYDRWRLAILWLRRGDPENYKHFEQLADAMRKPPEVGSIRRFRTWVAERIAP